MVIGIQRMWIASTITDLINAMWLVDGVDPAANLAVSRGGRNKVGEF
jgi:hypothetical protein